MFLYDLTAVRAEVADVDRDDVAFYYSQRV